MIGHVQFVNQAYSRFIDTVLVPRFTEAESLGVFPHKEHGFFGEADLGRGVEQVIPVHPVVIAVHFSALGQHRLTELGQCCC